MSTVKLGKYNAKVVEEVIGSGDSAIYKTIELMKKLAREDKDSTEIKSIAKEIKSECDSPTDACLAITAFEKAKEYIQYKFDDKNVVNYFDVDDPGMVEFVVRPKFYAGEGIKYGDCDDMATFLAAIYLALGIKVNFVIVAFPNEKSFSPTLQNDQFSHVFNEVLLEDEKGDNVWVPVDLVKGDFGWAKKPAVRFETFGVN